MIGNSVLLAGALALSRNSTSSLPSMAAAALAWLVVWDTMRPLVSVTTPKDFPHTSSRQAGSQIPPPYPDGWYNVLYSAALKRGEVKAVRALGRELVVWRTLDGSVSVMGAYCPHLGANLAIGGRVVGDCLQCPFHGWKFDSKGEAREAPGCETAPHGKAENYITVERNGMILIWLDGLHDAARRGRTVHSDIPPEVPAWEVPEAPLLKEATQFVGIVEHTLAAHIQEIPENGADGAHLNTVHAPFVVSALTGWVDHDWDFTWTPAPPNSKDAHTAVVGMKLGMKIFGQIWDSLMVRVHVIQIGPALVHEELTLPFGIGKIYFASSVTPVKPLEIRYTHAMWCSPYLPRIVAKMLLRGLKIQVDRDVPIWNNKIYRAKPSYTKADVNIPPFRRWFKQFYNEHSETFEQAMAIERGALSLEW